MRNWFQNDSITRPDGRKWTFIGQEKGLIHFKDEAGKTIDISPCEAAMASAEQVILEVIKNFKWDRRVIFAKNQKRLESEVAKTMMIRGEF
jgi:hypothetical protein